MTVEDQLIDLETKVTQIATDVTAIKSASPPVATVDLTAVNAKIDALTDAVGVVVAQFKATPAAPIAG